MTSRFLVGEVAVPYSSPEEFGGLALSWLGEGVQVLAGDISEEILAGPPLKTYWPEGVTDEEDPRFAIREPPLWGDISILYPPRNKHYAKPYSKTSVKRLDALAPVLSKATVSLRKEADGVRRSHTVRVDRLGEDSGFARLTVWIDPGEGGDLAAGCTELALLRAFAGRYRPVFGHVSRADRNRFAETELEQALVRDVRRTLPEWDRCLRGYSWVTIVPEALAGRVGGVAGLRASGVFAEVADLAGGVAWLQATRLWSEYAGNADVIERVFEALAPVLPPGKPRTRNVIRPEAPGMPEISVPYLTSGRDAAEYQGRE